MHAQEWLGMITMAVGWTIGSPVMVSISKNVLKKYIHETLMVDS